MEQKRYNEAEKDQDRKESSPRPNQETLHTTDPQEHMEGPNSTPMHKIGKAFDTDETKEEADSKRDRKL